MKSIFNENDVNEVIDRINKLTPSTQPQWGKMNVSQMLAHCVVAYDMTFTDKYPKPNAVSRFLIKLFAKSQVCGPKPYPKNGRTAPEFVITDERDFEAEKKRLVDYLHKTLEVGGEKFHMRESHAMGKLTTQEWNTLFYKHLNHHLTQFGV